MKKVTVVENFNEECYSNIKRVVLADLGMHSKKKKKKKTEYP